MLKCLLLVLSLVIYSQEIFAEQSSGPKPIPKAADVPRAPVPRVVETPQAEVPKSDGVRKGAGTILPIYTHMLEKLRYEGQIGHAASATELATCFPDYGAADILISYTEVVEEMQRQLPREMRHLRRSPPLSRAAAILLCKRGERTTRDIVTAMVTIYTALTNRDLTTRDRFAPIPPNVEVAAILVE